MKTTGHREPHAMPKPPSDIIDLKRLYESPDAYIVEIATINLADLTTAVARHPALYGFITAKKEVATVRVIRAEQKLKEAKDAAKDKLADLEDDLARRKQRVEEVSADVWLEFARQPKDARASVETIKREVDADLRVRNAIRDVFDANPERNAEYKRLIAAVRRSEQELVEARSSVAPLAAAERTFEHRRDALVHLGAHKNRELDNERR